MASKTVIINIGELLTNEPLAKENCTTPHKINQLGIKQDAWLSFENGKISQTGTMSHCPDFTDHKKIDAQGSFVMPGLVDSHTHPIFAGTRYHEFCQRIDGATYQEIASQGGGIQSTVKATREASLDDLVALGATRLQELFSHGITTVEVKSGYGLSVADELKMLQAIEKLKSTHHQTIKSTCLALHALPPEYKNHKDYIDTINNELLPQVKEQSLAEYVDVFIEDGYFSVADTESYIQKAKDLGFKIRIHADEFSNAGAAAAAARWQATSADHLQMASSDYLASMAQNNVVATILPGTSLYTNIPFTNAKVMVEQGCSVAIASDYNPGSCMLTNLPMLTTLSGLHCGLNMSQCFAGVTYIAAHSLGLAKTKGALSAGYDADFIIHPAKSAAEWLAQMGAHKPSKVFIKGKEVTPFT